MLILTACGPRTGPYETAERPKTDGYLSAVPAGHTTYSNDSLAEIFTKLTQFYENGGRAPGVYRFEGPVTVDMTGPGSDKYGAFLEQVITQIRNETGIDLSRGKGPANILIRFVPGEEFLPQTVNQCVIITGQPDWQAFVQAPGAYTLPGKDAPLVMSREGVLIPDTIEPFKVRQCILEELVQSLGTSNDLFGLSSTMFNDDQAHYWPTKLDYLMLRVLYDPEMEPSRDLGENQQRARKVLARLNPEGETADKLPPVRLHAFRNWRSRLRELSEDDITPARSFALASELAIEARRRAGGSAYDCLGQTTLAYAAYGAEEAGVLAMFDRAIDVCSAAHGPRDIRIAGLRLGRAYVDYDQEKYRKARDTARAVLPDLKAHGHDDRIAAALILETVASIYLEDANWVDTYLPRAEAWAAYTFGDDNDLTLDLRR
ncbi:MAG: DUF2927 domain-containing protein [Paracoccaceae bacterium]